MNLTLAKSQLHKALQKQKKLQEHIRQLRQYIKAHEPPIDLAMRNDQIYEGWVAGKMVAVLSREYKLGKDRIRTICKIVEKKRERAVSRSQKMRD